MEKNGPSLKSLSHPVRVQILFLLAERPEGKSFSDLSRELQIESSGKLAFHLEKLSDFVKKGDNGKYILTENGYKAIQALKLLGVNTEDDLVQNVFVKKTKVTSSESFNELKVKEEKVGNSEEKIVLKEEQGIKQISLLGVVLVIILGLILPSFVFILTTILNQDQDYNLGFPLFVITAWIGNVVTGYVIGEKILKSSSYEVSANPGLIYTIIIGTEYLFSVFIFLGMGNNFLLVFYVIIMYSGLILGAWTRHVMKSFNGKFVFLPRFNGDRFLITGLFLFLLSSINWYSKKISYNIYEGISTSEVISLRIYSGNIGLCGFMGFFVYLLILLFIFSKGNIIYVPSWRPYTATLVTSLILGSILIFLPYSVFLINLIFRLPLTQVAIILTYLTFSLLFFVFGAILAHRMYYAHWSYVTNLRV